MPRKNAVRKPAAKSPKRMQGGGIVPTLPTRLTGLDLARQKAAAQARARARPLAPPATSAPSSSGTTYPQFLKKGGKVKTKK